MNEQIAELLLQEFRSFRDTEFREFKDDVASWRQGNGERIATLETQVKDVVGNGQPGRLARVESEVKALSRFRWMVLGAASLMTLVAEWGKAILHKLF